MAATSSFETILAVKDYDLAATLSSGQAFRWVCQGDVWEGIIGSRWVSLRQTPEGIHVGTVTPSPNLDWLTHYLQSEVELTPIVDTFPSDEPLRNAVIACRGLRLLRQSPWECLASFILSSTKQIVQIQQIVGLLCERFGERVDAPAGASQSHAFPSAETLATCSEKDLRECKMGFRAPYLLKTARLVAEGSVNLESLRYSSLPQAREGLMSFPGVGRKIADCLLLFAYGFPTAFPVDVWVLRALQELYFPRRRVKPQRLIRFTETYFGPHAGYAQQYLFHYMRTKGAGRTGPD